MRCLRNRQHSVEITQCIEKFIKDASPDMRLSGLYVIDSISRAAYKHPENGGSSYLKLFEGMIEGLMPHLKGVPQSDEVRHSNRTLLLLIGLIATG